ncbi:MAG: hypothetical protein IPK27_06615 [Rhodanobacteraceae bacterium]|nr:hypothetical protein [Rhodanobacteraceae bacterium]
MPARKLISFLLVAAFAIRASVNDVGAAQSSESPVRDEVTQQASTPDEARIGSDLKNHYLFVGNLALGASPGSNDQIDSLAIRTSVRKGEVIEFRVTSVYYADLNGEPQREVDSIVSYRMDGDNWVLRSVQVEGTRNVTPSNPGNAAEPC